MTDRFTKNYALIKSQWLSSNILDEYLPFIATIIIDEGMEIVDENIVCSRLNEKYHANFQPTFVRQVISNAMAKDAVQKVHGNYVANKSVLKQHYILDEDFENNWSVLLDDFCKYATQQGYTISRENLENNISSFIDAYDDRVIFNHIEDIDTAENTFLYHWCNYIISLNSTNEGLYSFVVGLCTANLVKATLFYSSNGQAENIDLQVFLDTPMVFALLGMDTPERKSAFKYIVDKAKSLGMTLHVFDHNLEEVLGIMERASKWAQRADYDNAKANRVAQYFHDSEMTPEDMVEYIGNVESELNLLGITRSVAGYIDDENAFQADENSLFNAIKAEYGKRSLKYYNEEIYENSIRTDVRSIVMVQRKRQGSLATVIKTAKIIFITTNGVIAKVSKDIMQADTLMESKIPASITADIFGTLLWMDFPDSSNDYQSMKLLADCKALLRPSPQMIATFKIKLDEAYKKHAEGLTEEKFLFLRSHPIVQTKLLDATTGDYAQFTDQTWREVYNQIESHAIYEGEKKYQIEKEDHFRTRKELDRVKEDRDAEIAYNERLKQQIVEQQERFATIVAKVIAAVIFGLPYVASSVVIILIQNQHGTPTIKGIIIIVLTLLLAFLSKTLYGKLTNVIKGKVKAKL
ncbi:MAG: hypothetical protein Q4D50_07695 [Eubacteriales bacterium]|nr:hypothetical protein [Eubacteriales bacterium]